MERDQRKDKDVSSSQIVQGVNVSLNEFMKLAFPTFTGTDSLKDSQRFLDDIWWRCEALGSTDHRAMSLASFGLEGEVAISWFEFRKRARLGTSLELCSWTDFFLKVLRMLEFMSLRGYLKGS